MEPNKKISVINAKVHNLKGVNVEIPKYSLTTITGPSGSGKSSLAFDTIYKEGQRRYIESLSSYARQFLGQFSPPDVESITGLSPSIAIDQKSSSKNPRSTVGTITEIYDYMRILFARAGTLYCVESGEEVKKYTANHIIKELLKNKEKTKIIILSPVYFKNKKELKLQLNKFVALGFSRFRVDGDINLYESTSFVDKLKTDSKVEIVVDRIVIKPDVEKRLTDSIEHSLKISDGDITVLVNEKEYFYSEKNMAPKSKRVYPDLEPRLFSFNSPLGACSRCNGIGESKSFELSKMITDDTLSIIDGAVAPLSKKNNFLYKMVQSIAESEKIDLSKPFNKLPKSFLKILLEGSTKKYQYSFESENSEFKFSKEFPGISNWLDKKYKETTSERVRSSLEEYMEIKECPDCHGLRLNEIALNTKINKNNIMDLCVISISDTLKEIQSIKLSGDKKIIAEKVLKEIISRLNFLNNVGLGYLSLNRSAASLSGGETQRIRLATQIGSALSGVLYVLDEPSIGLHQRDNQKLISTLKSLRDIGNTVLVVEHDEETMKESDYIIDIGPGAGINGGRVVASGKLESVLENKDSITAQYLSGKRKIEIPKERKKLNKVIKLKGAKKNNLKKLDVEIPLEGLVCITGVSGSGKSTLVHNVLTPAIKNYIAKNSSYNYAANYNSISGVDYIDSIIELDQAPIGRTPHSNPATYTGLFDNIRKIFASTNESKVRGYKPGRFSFNVKGGRCEECEGNGVKKIEMHFLPDVYITCSECKGSRYNKETLSILYRGKNIAEVLDMEIEEGVKFFSNHTKIHRALETMNSVGLGYMKLGQPATTLSGGEAQRLKLSRELSKKKRGHCLYILDEPTTGLHFEDIQNLLKAINNLIDQGNSVIVIEHNLDVIKCADHIIDLGPDGGDNGGQVVATGTPEEVAKTKGSATGKFLKEILK